MEAIDTPPSQPGAVTMFFKRLGEIQQGYLDKATPHLAARWIFLIVWFLLYGVRVYFYSFLTPQVDPAIMDDEEDGPSLPTKSNEEFKPFMRRLPEFKFWYSAVKAVTVAMICTCFDALNIPVFWPILVMYFILLFVITMKRQIKHMLKYKYLPFSHGKKKYQGKEDTGKVVYNK